ncbi:hydroxymethylglutaryl-CoA synthase [Kallotenue papyrolyticum]|uniref:hydroxymethylglutaryl-CoA synthase n=1 Tax=Kallotenue papyrolyticum TaxID=1325125 RepID=UPI0004785978|nr:hydroxymethylglutaryl-CoA synthase [Kallotenue papyrolyticum]
MPSPVQPTGIIGYGAYVPRYRIAAAEIARVWNGGAALPITEKAVPGPDEDTITMAIEAGRNALRRAAIPATALATVWVGSESHPYAVKPSGTIVAAALGCGPQVSAADWEFACKAGTEALTAAMGMVGAGMARYALAIGADTAQGRPGDALEYTAAAGAAALIVGPAQEALATLDATCSYVSDTPDFFRRAERPYPVHGNRFTGTPAYFAHIEQAARRLLRELDAQPGDFHYAVFHQPNTKFPQTVARRLGFAPQQIAPGLLAPRIGNSYSAAALLGLCATLDVAAPGERILLVSYGSGAGADAYALTVTEQIGERRARAPHTEAYLNRRVVVDYATYARWRGKLRLG